jgi:hypothetical protein
MESRKYSRVGLVLAFLLLPAWLYAANLKVNCDGKSPHKSSITAALQHLPPGPNTITVSGTCRENVLIAGIDDLTLAGTPGASVVDQSATALFVIQIEHSKRVTITGLEVVGGTDGIFCTRASDCIINNNDVHGGLGGIWLYDHSAATLAGNHVHGTGNGVGVAYSSYALLRGGTAPPFGGPSGDPNIIEDNTGIGLYIVDGSTCRVQGSADKPNIIRNNGGSGVWISHAVGTLIFPVITGNGIGNTNVNSGGVELEGGILRISSAQITGNSGPGLFAAHGSHADVGGSTGSDGTTISGNERNGVVLLLNSSAGFGGVNPVTLNGHSDVFCDAFSVLQNMNHITGATVVNCPNQVIGYPVP